MSVSHTMALLLVALVPACKAVPVSFECSEDEPLCSIIEIESDERPPAAGIDITGVALYQGTEIWLMQDGDQVFTTSTPIVQYRDAMFRVFVTPNADWQQRQLTCRLYIYLGATTIGAYQADMTVSSASTAGSLESTFNFTVPGYLMLESITWEVELVEADAESDPGGQVGLTNWPPEGSAALDLTWVGDSVKLMIVPIEYNADGSGRLPDTSEEQMQTYLDYMFAFYPTPDMEIQLAEPMPTDTSVTSSGGGWSQLLQQLTQSRDSLGIDDDVYLFGPFEPASDFDSFCRGGCVLGLSNLAISATDVYSRASIGLGYTGTTSAETMVHEVGHAHGLNHAPCGGATGVDPNYPYENASIGVRGYNLVDETLKDPNQYFDVMSYCAPTWISDYNFDLLLERIAEVNQLASASAMLPTTTWWTVWLHSDGHLSWGTERYLRRAPTGATRALELLSESGELLGRTEAFFTPFSGLPGGVFTFPAPTFPVSMVRLGELTTAARAP